MNITEKKLRSIIRKSITREGNLLGFMTDYDEPEDTGYGIDSSGCPIVSSWEEVFPALVSSDIISSQDTILVLDGAEQRLKLVTGGNVTKDIVCSTSANGFGNQSGSGETSTGLARVRGKVGGGQPVGMVFKGLRPTGHVLGPNEGVKAWVLTRAITLTGLQRPNRNISSRAIYIHGTNRERVLGVPASGGCVRVSSNDVLWIYDNVPVGTVLYILGDPRATNPKFPCEKSEIYEREEREEKQLLEIDGDPIQDAGFIRGEPQGIDHDPTA